MELEWVAALPQRTITHGVGYPVGGTICDQGRHIAEFCRWTDRLASPWTSEHLSILEVKGASGRQSCGFLMPPRQTDAQVSLAVANIKRRAASVGRPFAFETGVNYFLPRQSEMNDGDFFAAIAEEADCGILLDLNNIWVNAKNGRARIDDVLSRLPLERVWEVHLAGATYSHGYWLDAHSGAIEPELAAIAAEVVGDLANLGAIIFEIAPDNFTGFGAAAFLRQMETVNRLWDIAPPTAALSTRVTARGPVGETKGPTPEEWERQIAIKMLPTRLWPVGADAVPPLRDSDERSFDLYAHLVASAQHSAIAELLSNSVRLLLIALGEQAVRDILDGFSAIAATAAFPTDEALGFARFALSRPADAPGFADVLRFEAAGVEAAANSCSIRVALARDIGVVLDDIALGRVPGPSSKCQPFVLEIGVDPEPFVRLAG
ncbi:DUF692 family multinuclear iron-containing protein [Methylocella sp.]|uniref:multinuclear nonheme iron-dependent oxidase n=1 Tax=Methylocella sp. TaxID=1978226 RepID=UPI003C175D88